MKYVLLFCAFLMITPLQSQALDLRIAPTQMSLSEVEMLKMPPLDNKSLMETELKRRQPGLAPKFAEVIAVDVKPMTHGNWEYLDDGTAVWRLRINSPGAYSLNLGFTLFQMPEGGQLILYSSDQERVRGPFTPADNEDHAQLWTPILEGDEMVLEVQLPKEKIPELGLHLSTINHDFMGFAQVASGNCNLDVLCGAADGYEFVDAYRDEIQSVAIYGVQGNLFCTGFLVNNTREDCTPFFMTAAHCEVTESEAASLVVYWNYENSTCRELGSSANGRGGDGQLNDFNSGAILRANYNPSDMALLELDDPVSATAEAYFAGWSRESTAPQRGVVSIHHPNADEKSISYATQATYKGTWESGTNEVSDGDHIIVPEWSIGTTEVGSSGAPLFDDAGLVVGQLHGGIADCTGGGYDTFGWFAASWEGGGTPATSLRHWLDPDNTGVMSFSGRSQLRCSFFVEAAINSKSAVCAPEEAVYTLQVSEAFSDSVNLQVNGLPEGLEATLSESIVMPGESTELRIKGTDVVDSDIYSFTVIGTDGTESAAAQLELTIFRDVPSQVNLLEPADGAMGVSIRAGFYWANQPFTTRYEYELANDSDFNDIVASVSDLGSTQLATFELAALTTYYWRVRGRNLCGWSDWSTPRSFTTAGVGCATIESMDIPKNISGSVNTVTSTINITAPGSVQDIQLTGLDISHSYVGDLRVSLVSPQGTEVILFDRPGLPRTFFGCDGDNLYLNFSDNALNTAEELENTCNSLPAIQGSFQPVEALATFSGETLTGIWTLKVADVVPEDAGRLHGWGLDFCTTIPQEQKIYPITDQYQICAKDYLSFDLLLGGAFPDATLISVAGLPGEATVVFSDNPAYPGASINVEVGGLNTGGAYDLVFSADTAQMTIHIDVMGLPAAVLPMQPADSAVVNQNEVILAWQSSLDADYYILEIFEEVIGGTSFLSINLTDTFYILEDLDFGTNYFWQVSPQSVCGGDQPEKYQNFFTRPDIALAVNPESLVLCQAEEATINIEIGSGFINPARISYQIEPEDTIEISYNVDPESVIPGGVVGVNLDQLNQLEAGLYRLTFFVRDSVFEDSVAVDLEVLSPPPLSRLLEPENNTELLDPLLTFSWEEVPEVNRYRFELGKDASFSEVILSEEIDSSKFSLTEALEQGTYYWRITVINRCGGATSAAFRFNLNTTSVTEWDGGTLKWYPNPTPGKGHLQLARPLVDPIAYQILNSAGIQVLTGEILPGAEQITLDLSRFPSGVYLLRLQRDADASVLKIIRQ